MWEAGKERNAFLARLGKSNEVMTLFYPHLCHLVVICVLVVGLVYADTTHTHIIVVVPNHRSASSHLLRHSQHTPGRRVAHYIGQEHKAKAADTGDLNVEI